MRVPPFWRALPHAVAGMAGTKFRVSGPLAQLGKPDDLREASLRAGARPDRKSGLGVGRTTRVSPGMAGTRFRVSGPLAQLGKSDDLREASLRAGARPDRKSGLGVGRTTRVSPGMAGTRFRVSGPLAQLVEQLAFNQLVVGSSPTRPTNLMRKPVLRTGFFVDTGRVELDPRGSLSRTASCCAGKAWPAIPGRPLGGAKQCFAGIRLALHGPPT